MIFWDFYGDKTRMESPGKSQDRQLAQKIFVTKNYLHSDESIGGRDDERVERDDRGMEFMFEGPNDFHFVPSSRSHLSAPDLHALSPPSREKERAPKEITHRDRTRAAVVDVLDL